MLARMITKKGMLHNIIYTKGFILVIPFGLQVWCALELGEGNEKSF
jgi:hypothetical protein